MKYNSITIINKYNYMNKKKSRHILMPLGIGSLCLLLGVEQGWAAGSVTAKSTGNSNSHIVPELPQSGKFKVSGKVTDDKGDAVIGASVIQKGTTNGVTTDFDGKYTIEVSSSTAVLSISYLGYLPQDVKVDGKHTVNITLKENAHALDEVVVVGFGTQKKINLTGSVAMVDAEVIESRPVQNVSQALQGVVPGLNFSVNTGGVRWTIR